MATGEQANVSTRPNVSCASGAYAAELATTAATGTTPPDSVPPAHSTSGTTPSASAPHQWPSRPNPVCVSSSTRNAPCTRHSSAAADR